MCRHKRKDYWNAKLSDPKKKTADILSHINSVTGREKRASADGIQSVEFQAFLLRKVDSARTSIQAREEHIYLAHAQGSLSRLQDVMRMSYTEAYQQCASDPIPTRLF